MEAKKIIPLWQPVGYSTHLISQRMGEKLEEKTSHTGTLDPMAEGVIIILVGKERLKKKDFSKWLKTYSFEMTFGISTDTYDSMGLISETHFKKINKRTLQKIVKEMPGEYTQKLPPYSTKKIFGKHLHQYARLKEEISPPLKTGNIFSLTLEDLKTVETEKQICKQIEKINKVSGDFRQKEIISQWNEFLNNKKIPKHLQTARFKVETSSGIYIRSLTQDMAEKLKNKSFASEIIRLKNGPYSRKNSYNLEKYFSKQEIKGDYFSSKTLII